MKTTLNSNITVTDAERDKIKKEIKEVVNKMFKGCELADFDMAIKSMIDSPDLVYIFNGTLFGYRELDDAIRPLFNSLLNQEIKIIDEKYIFLDKSKVIYVANCTFLENYKDGHSTLSDPMVMQLTFIKTNGQWKVINGVESSVRKDIK